MAKETKTLPRAEIIARLNKAKVEGRYGEEISQIMEETLGPFADTEQENEEPEGKQIYKVNFVSRRKDTGQINRQQIPDVESTLFYRHAPHMESLVFAPPHVAQHISEIHSAFSAETWGEFLRKIPQSEFWQLWNSRCEDEEEPLPDPELPFSPEDICGAFCEGDYPAWLQQDQDRWLPNEILERWGKKQSSGINGSFWIIDPAQEQEIVQRLSELGITARQRGDLRFH